MPKKTPKTPLIAKNSFYNTVYSLFTANPFASYNYKQISARLGINDRASRDLVKNIISELYKNHLIIEAKQGRYRLKIHEGEVPETRRYITGVVDMKQTGKAYVISPDLPEDVFILPGNTHHALNGDKVKVFLFPKRKGKKDEGEIVEIISRTKKQFVGIVEITKHYAFLNPDSASMPVDIFIPVSELNGARNGQKAVAIITDWPQQSENPFGKIIHVLGNPGDNNVEMQSILAECNFPLSFTANALKEAAAIPETIPVSEISRRRDFRDTLTFTIDPADAKDFDDALSFRRLPNGNMEVGVHIADVSWYVMKGTAIDKEAFERGTSIYLVDRTIPMLPEKLSNEMCSLKPHCDRLCYAAVFEMNEEAEILEEWIGKTIIHSNRRFNYDEVQEIIETGKGEFSEEIGILNKLAVKLRDKRFANGSINFETQEVKFHLDKNGKPTGVYIKEMKDSNKLIEDFMLLANRRVAEKIGWKKGKDPVKTFVYRVHDSPHEEKLNTFITFVNKLGYKMKVSSRKGLAESMNRLFEQIKGKGEENMIETIAVRTMQKAYYSTENIGHYGLAFRFYTHFTSPIRRYPDLMVHRLLDEYTEGKKSVDKEDYEEQCEHCSDMEKKASEAERASVKYKQAEFLLDKIGHEFDGLISGVSKWGVYVEIVGNKCEGMVRLRDLEDDFYYLDDENYQVIGQRYGRQYKLGDTVRIRVKNVDVSRKQMDYEMVP